MSVTARRGRLPGQREHHGTDSVARHLNRVTTNTSWREATGSWSVALSTRPSCP
ncbi:hypothetical protein ACWENO_34875 [Streptomyces sp. NPDC004436]